MCPSCHTPELCGPRLDIPPDRIEDEGSVEVAVYSVPGVHCAHCSAAITAEVIAVPGVERVDVDLEAKVVSVRGVGVSDAEVRGAIAEAGYDVAA
jgi:copper chaperone CopZ